MLILDKPRAMDLMVAQASRAPVPEEFSLDPAARTRGGFRVALYERRQHTAERFDEQANAVPAMPLSTWTVPAAS